MKKILYVESSATSQHLMRKYLVNLAELVMAPDLRPGVATAEAQLFDLVITGFLFPTGDAFSLIHQLRRAPATRDIPIIVVSSSMDDFLVDRLLKAGANEARGKPIQAAEFRAIVERMLAAPYVREAPVGLSSVNCFQWSTPLSVNQFCPELGLVVSGATKEETSRRMSEAIKAHQASGAAVGFTYQETVITHRFRPDPIEDTSRAVLASGTNA